MAISPASKRAAERAAASGIAAEKARYAELLERLKAVVVPPLSNRELSVGLELDPPTSLMSPRGSQVGRFVSEAPRNRRARPDRQLRAVLDRLAEGAARLCVQLPAIPGERRNVLVCEPADADRLGRDWTIVDLTGRTRHGAQPEVSAAPTWPNDDAMDWSGGAPSSPPPPAAAAPVAPAPARAPTATVARRVTSSPGAATLAPRPLGTTGFVVPPIGLGGMRLSTRGRPERDAAIALVHAALDAGVRFIDSADVYCLDDDDLHHNERLVAEALATWEGPREQVVVATKVGLRRPGGRWVACGRPDHILASAERSREALGGAPIALYQLHARDRQVPFAETLDALAQVQQRGDALHLGVCNVSRAELTEAVAAITVATVQNKLNPFDKAGFTNGIFDETLAAAIGLIAHSPVGGYAKHARVAKHAALNAVATKHAASPYEVALAWQLSLGPHLFAIPGATRLESVQSSARAARLVLDDTDREALEQAFKWSAAVRSRAAGATFAAPPPAQAAAVAPAPRPAPAAIITTPGPSDAAAGELVFTVGLPAAGKSTLIGDLVDRGYQRFNRDTVGGTLAKLVPLAAQAIADGHRHLVLDNTYPTRGSRAPLVALARQHGLRVRCLLLGASLDDARYNAALRLFRRYGRALDPGALKAAGKRHANAIPPHAQSRFLRIFEAPEASEGIDVIEPIPFARRDPDDHVHKALLLDADGTLRITKSGAPFPTDPDDVVLMPHRREVLARWVAAGYRLFGVSNQAGVALGQVSEDRARACFDRTQQLLGLPIAFSYCPHPAHPVRCWCRKPLPALGVNLIERHRLRRDTLVMVGDRDSDAGFAQALGVRYADASAFFTADAGPPAA